jgi:hypothetical protein
MAWLAFSIATRVSRLMLADSIALICCSSVPICETVWSSECSCVFLRLKAALAAVISISISAPHCPVAPVRAAYHSCLC